MGKRGRSEQLGLKDGRAAVNAILKLNAGHLFADNKVTPLPYPGIGTPTERPPFELYYVGTEAVFDLFLKFGNRDPRCVIEGPRGFGKSSDLRALACLVYNFIYREGKQERLVCIWNMDAAVNNVASVVRDAILFACLFPRNNMNSGDPSIGESSEKKVLNSEKLEMNTIALETEINQISSIEEAVSFIKRRKGTEDFHFFVDSWELLDETDSKGKPSKRRKQRVLVQQQLATLFAEGKQVWYAASAKSYAATALGDESSVCKFQPFNEVQYRAYSSHSILGKILGREKDIDYYTGRVPIFLDVLCDCCMKFVSHVNAAEKDRLREEACRHNLKTVLEMAKARFQVRDVDQIVELLQEDYNWGVVLKLFREHPALEQVKETIDNISIERSCHEMEEMGKLDRTYFIRQSKRYCSDFISRMYIEAFRAKEAQIRKLAGGAWIPYCQYLVRQPNVNWSSVGWVVEDLVADVVKHKAVFLGKSIGQISDLKLREFSEIPILDISELLKVRGGHGYYYKPRLFSFPYVDGIVVYADMIGHLHIIGLQVTVNVDNHLLSALLFMSIRHLKRWFPDIESNFGNVQLHFVFIGWSKQWLEDVREDDQQVQVRKLKGGKSYGIAAHKRTYLPLSIAMAALSEDDLDVVQEVVEARVSQLPKLPLTLAALWHLKKKELEEIAQQYGIGNPKQYNKDELISELENLA